MQRYRVHFTAGDPLDIDERDADAAKTSAKAQRAAQVGRTQIGASDPRLTVTRVEPLNQ